MISLLPVYSSKGRIFGLDIVRGVAMLFVLMSHVLTMCPDFFLKEAFILYFGMSSVESFFSLSGFLIGTILLKLLLKTQRFDFHIISDFWKRRWLRTLPLFLFMLSINTVYYVFFSGGGMNLNSLKGFVRNLFFVGNFITPHYDYMATNWSLSIEEWSYLLLPVVIFIFCTLFKGNHRKKVFVFSALSIIFVSFILRISLFVTLHYNITSLVESGELIPASRHFVVLRLDATAYGVLLSYFWVLHKEIIQKQQNKLLLTGLIILAIPFYLFWKYLSGSEVTYLDFAFLFPLLNISFAFMFPFFISIKRQYFYPGFVKFIEVISIISYSLYLVHDLVMQFYNPYFPLHTFVDITFRIPLFLGLSYVISVFTYNYIERPGMLLREDTTWFFRVKDKIILYQYKVQRFLLKNTIS